MSLGLQRASRPLDLHIAIPPYLHATTPTTRLQVSRPPMSPHLQRASRPHILTSTAGFQVSRLPYLHTPRVQRTSKTPYLYVSHVARPSASLQTSRPHIARPAASPQVSTSPDFHIAISTATLKRRDFYMIEGKKGLEAWINLGKPSPLYHSKALALIRIDPSGVESSLRLRRQRPRS